MLRLALAGAIALAMSPAFAQEQKACEHYMDQVAGQIIAGGNPLTFIPEDQLPLLIGKLMESGIDAEGATRAFIAQFNGAPVVGYEKDGCLMPPVMVSAMRPVHSRSGRVNGMVYA